MTELKLQKKTAKRLFPESPDWFRRVLTETFGEDAFKKRDFNDIKTFEDACEELGIDPSELNFESDTTDEIAYKKLKIVVKAINQGWEPDWNDTNQRKWYPWFKVRSSGFCFSISYYVFGYSLADVGSRLCFESEARATHTATQFIDLYNQFLTINK